MSHFARLGMQPHTGRWCIRVKYIPCIHGVCQFRPCTADDLSGYVASVIAGS